MSLMDTAAAAAVDTLVFFFKDFRSPKTAQVMQKVGLERMVLETDHEDAAFVQPSMREGIAYIAQALGVDEATVIETTTKNALDLYGLS